MYDDSQHTYLSPESSKKNSGAVTGRGKNLSMIQGGSQKINKSHLSANVICKVLMHKGLLFDIQERELEEAFSTI